MCNVIQTFERGDQVKVEKFGDCRKRVLVSHHGIVGWIGVVTQRGNVLLQPIFKRKALHRSGKTDLTEQRIRREKLKELAETDDTAKAMLKRDLV